MKGPGNEDYAAGVLIIGPIIIITFMYAHYIIIIIIIIIIIKLVTSSLSGSRHRGKGLSVHKGLLRLEAPLPKPPVHLHVSMNSEPSNYDLTTKTEACSKHYKPP